MAEEEQGRHTHPPAVITPTCMAEGGISVGDIYLPPQPKPIVETGRTNTVHVGEWVYPYIIRVDHVGTNPKGQRGYLGDRAVRDRVEGGGGGDRYLY